MATEITTGLSPILAPSVARTATGGGEIYDTGEAKEFVVTLDVSAASGTTPTLDVKLQHSAYDSVYQDLSTAFTQKTAVSKETKVFTQFHRYVKATWTIGGTTPSFTFSIKGTARK